jgi:beta-glucosidase
VRRILRVKFRLGLFDDPYRYSDPAREKAATLTPAHLAAARDVARKSVVLLKNDGGLLPLRRAGTIAVVGPLAADQDSPLGNWRGQGAANSAVSLLEGVKAAAGSGARVVHAPGVVLTSGQRTFLEKLTFNTEDRSGIPAAVEAARAADVVVVAVGEDAYQSGEGRSQADISLKGLQSELLRAVYGANKKMVVVLMTGRPVTIPELAAYAPAIVQGWLLGSESGNALADVLFGDYNPSGKLPVGFPRHVGQLPMSYARKSTGRPGPQTNEMWSHYTDVANEPLFPFGFGLSYTSFSYSAPAVSTAKVNAGETVTVKTTVTNTGTRPGTEVAQLYVRDLVGSTTRPIKELKGFQKVELAPGQAKEVAFTLTTSDLAYYTARGKWEAEPGAFRVFVGGNSRDLQEAGFELVAPGPVPR